jgi:hypothetical protein
MKLTKTLALVAALSVSLMATAAHAVTFVFTGTNADGNTVSATMDITAVGDHVTMRVTNNTAGMFASNQAISDILLNFTTDVTGATNFGQTGQRGIINADGTVTLIAGDPTRWDASNPGGNTYLDVLGGGSPTEMIASNSIGDPNGGLANFNPYIMGDAFFTFDLLGASNLRIADMQFSFGTNHEFIGHGTCTFGCGGVINPTGVVPEPATWAMMILGVGGIGAMLRRKRALARRAAYA